MKRLASLLMVLVACAAVRVWLIANTEAIARDGTIYIKMAREWSADPPHVVQSYDYHVGFPALFPCWKRRPLFKCASSTN